MTEAAVNPVYEKLLAGNQPRAPIGSGEARDGNRILSIPSRGNGRFVLRFVDTRHGEYVIPVGRVATRKRDEVPVHERNVLVPVLPRVYTTPDLDPAKCAVPRAPGWLYVFKNGYLWRELEVLPQGWLRDVNLHKYAGRDVRPATVEKDNRLLLPYRLDGEAQAIRMAYADVQWSWARINMLGGMDPADFRLHPDHLPPMPQDMGYSDDQIAEAQNARLQQIDLSGFDAGFPVQPAEGRTARIENVEHANDRLVHIRLHRKANIPVVYLDDPLGIARALAVEHQQAWQTMADFIAEIADPANRDRHPYAPWFDSAVLANQYFFVEHAEPETPNVERYPGQPRDRKWEKARELRAEWRKRLSLDDIQTALGTRRRAELRQQIVDTREALVAWLSPESENFAHLLAAWDDYCTLPHDPRDADAPHSGQRYALANLLLARVADHEYRLDLHLETNPPSQKRLLEIERNNPGRRLLARLLDPQGGHPLRTRLFLSTNGNQPGTTTQNAPAQAVSPLLDAGILGRLGRRAAGFIVTFVEHFASVAAELRHADMQKHLVALLVESNVLPGLERVEVDLQDYLHGRLPQELAEKYEILSLRVISVEPDLDYPAKRRFDGGSIETPDGTGGPIVIEDRQGNVVGSTSLAAYREGRVLSNTALKRHMRRRAMDRVTVEAWLHRKLTGLPALAEQLKDTHGIMRLLLPIAVVLEGWNLQSAFVALKKGYSEEQQRAHLIAEFVGAIADTAALAAYVNEIRVKSLQTTQKSQSYRAKLAIASAWSGGLSFIAGAYSATLSVQDMLRNAHEGDDAAIANGIMALGSAAVAASGGLQATGAVLSLLGVEATGLLATGISAAGTFALAGLGIALVGAALLVWVFREDTPLEEWLANGPFSTAPPAEDEIIVPIGELPDDRSQRFAGYKPGEPVENRFHVWYLQPRTAFEDLLDAIYQPVADLRLKTPVVGTPVAELAVHLPNYLEGRSRLFVEWWMITRHGDRKRLDERKLRIRTGFGSGPRSTRQWLPIPREADRIEVRLWLDLYGDERYRLPLAPLRWTKEEAESWRRAAMERAIRPVGQVQVSGAPGREGPFAARVNRGVSPILLEGRVERDRFKAL